MAELSAITGLAVDEAAMLLEAAGGDLAMAATLHFEPDALQAGGGGARPGSSDDGGPPYDYGGDDYDLDEAAYDAASNAADAAGRAPPPLAGGRQPLQPSRWRVFVQWMALYMPFTYGVALGGYEVWATRGLLGLLGSLLWAPLALLGLTPPSAAPPPHEAVQQFEEWFEAEHGTTHPRFFRGSCQSAIGRSRSEARFVLAYVHDGRSDACARRLRASIRSPPGRRPRPAGRRACSLAPSLASAADVRARIRPRSNRVSSPQASASAPTSSRVDRSRQCATSRSWCGWATRARPRGERCGARCA